MEESVQGKHKEQGRADEKKQDRCAGKCRLGKEHKNMGGKNTEQTENQNPEHTSNLKKLRLN